MQENSQISEKQDPPAQVGFIYPEGGWRAWAAVLGAWLVQFCTFGYTNAFGVYQDFYVREYMTNFTSSEISWIGSVQTMLLFSVGLFAGRAFDRGYFYHMMIGGSALFIVCLFMLSLSHPQSYYQVFLSQGLGVGIAFGITYIPSLAVVGHYFQRRRVLAMGIAASGSSVGGIIHPIMLNHLFHGSAGFHVGVRASAGLNLGLMAIALLLLKPRLPPKRTGVTMLPQLWSFCHDPPYVFAVLAAFFVLCALLFPFFFLQLDAITHGIDPNLAFYTLAIMNAASTLGRVIGGFFGPSLGVFNLVVASIATSAIFIYCMLAVRTVGGFVVFSVLFGLSSGVYVSLLAPMLIILSHDVTEIGARMGICFTVIGIAALISSPITGSLLSTEFVWWRPIIFAGTSMTTGTILFTTTRFLLWRKKLKTNPHANHII